MYIDQHRIDKPCSNIIYKQERLHHEMRIVDKGFSDLQFEQIMFVPASPFECDIEAP